MCRGLFQNSVIRHGRYSVKMWVRRCSRESLVEVFNLHEYGVWARKLSAAVDPASGVEEVCKCSVGEVDVAIRQLGAHSGGPS